MLTLISIGKRSLPHESSRTDQFDKKARLSETNERSMFEKEIELFFLLKQYRVGEPLFKRKKHSASVLSAIILPFVQL